jgi:hypothetical protein
MLRSIHAARAIGLATPATLPPTSRGRPVFLIRTRGAEGASLYPRASRSQEVYIRKLAALALITLGGMGLLYGGFSSGGAALAPRPGQYQVDVGGHFLVDVPEWTGIAALIYGGFLLFLPRRKN